MILWRVFSHFWLKSASWEVPRRGYAAQGRHKTFMSKELAKDGRAWLGPWRDQTRRMLLIINIPGPLHFLPPTFSFLLSISKLPYLLHLKRIRWILTSVIHNFPPHSHRLQSYTKVFIGSDPLWGKWGWWQFWIIEFKTRNTVIAV